jgi:hypothetical protein
MTETTKKGRGPDKGPRKPRAKTGTLVHINLRLPPEVTDYFKTFPNYSEAIRKVLTEYVEDQTHP